MASIDEELLRDDEENRREIAFIRTQLPAELKEKYTDGQLLDMMDAIGEYFFSSGVLETDDDEVDINLEEVSRFVCKEVHIDGLDPDDVYFVVQADLDFQEQDA